MENKKKTGPSLNGGAAWLRDGVWQATGWFITQISYQEFTAYITGNLCSKASRWLRWDCQIRRVFWGPSSPILLPPPLPVTLTPNNLLVSLTQHLRPWTDTNRVRQWGPSRTLLPLTKPWSLPHQSFLSKQANPPSTIGLSVTLLPQRSYVHLPASLSCMLSASIDNSQFSINKCRHFAQIFTGTVNAGPQLPLPAGERRIWGGRKGTTEPQVGGS